MLTSSPCKQTIGTCDNACAPGAAPPVPQEASLYLVGLKRVRVTGQPLHQVTRDHVAGAAGERWVGRAGVL